MSPIIRPQKPATVERFMQSVQPDEPIGNQISNIGSQVVRAAGSVLYMPVAAAKHTLDVGTKAAKATGRVAASPVSAVASVAETASYVSANTTGLLPVVFNKIGKGFSTVRTKAGNLFKEPGAKAA